MSITPGGNIPMLGEGGRPVNNPLVVLNGHLGQISDVLAEIAANTRPDATAVLPHVYTLVEVHDDGHGAMWGSVCLACSDSAGTFTYPCALLPDQAIKPPAFFTIGDVFTPDEHGRMLKHGGS